MTLRSIFSALAVFAISLAESGSALAYCRTKACDTDPSYGDVWDEQPQPTECVRNGQGCFIQGTPLYWAKSCLTFGVQRDGSQSSGIDFQTAEAVIQDGFDKWQTADCGGGETPRLRVVAKGEIVCGQIEYNQKAPNANVFLFRDESWPYGNVVGAALALTTVTYNVETGEIYDADVELNSHEARFTTTDEPIDIVTDLSSVVTHEIGHVLGLGHSEISTSVMRNVGYIPGTIDMRTLTSDDVSGVCEIFPPGSSPSNDCGPRHGFSRECGSKTTMTTGGCSLGPTPNAAEPRSLATFAALALVLCGRRIRRVKRR